LVGLYPSEVASGDDQRAMPLPSEAPAPDPGDGHAPDPSERAGADGVLTYFALDAARKLRAA